MNNKALTKLTTLESKISLLKCEREKIIHSLGIKVIEELHKKEAFNHDFKTLINGIIFVANELNNPNSNYKKQWTPKTQNKKKVVLPN